MFTPLKSVLLGTVFAVSAVGVASAADPIMPTPVMPVVPVVDSGFDWTGFYAGLGVTGSAHNWTFESDDFDVTMDPNIFSGELVLGGNVQFDSVVLGLEGTFGAYTSNISGEATGDFSDLPQEVQDFLDGVDGTYTGSSSGLTAGLSARLGYLVTPNVLLYGSAGAMGLYSQEGTSITYTDPDSGDTVTETTDEFGNVFGNIGLGAELAVSDNISLDLEYKYYGISLLDFLEEDDGNGSSTGHGVSAQILFHF